MTKSQADLLSKFCFQTSSLSVPPVGRMDMPARTARPNYSTSKGRQILGKSWRAPVDHVGHKVASTSTLVLNDDPVRSIISDPTHAPKSLPPTPLSSSVSLATRNRYSAAGRSRAALKLEAAPVNARTQGEAASSPSLCPVCSRICTRYPATTDPMDRAWQTLVSPRHATHVEPSLLA